MADDKRPWSGARIYYGILPWLAHEFSVRYGPRARKNLLSLRRISVRQQRLRKSLICEWRQRLRRSIIWPGTCLVHNNCHARQTVQHFWLLPIKYWLLIYRNISTFFVGSTSKRLRTAPSHYVTRSMKDRITTKSTCSTSTAHAGFESSPQR
jgi:hypothetical protein